MDFTFNFYHSNPKPMSPLNISVENENCTSQHTSYMQEMDQGLEQRDLGKNTANGIPMRETGGREKSNKCNQCDSTFSRADHLRTHLRTHSGEKPNKCNQCDFASIQAGDLRTHLKTHSGEKSNKCNQCDFASSRAGNLRTHLRTHSGEKPNKCNKCDYASSYARHIQKPTVTMHPLIQAL